MTGPADEIAAAEELRVVRWGLNSLQDDRRSQPLILRQLGLTELASTQRCIRLSGVSFGSDVGTVELFRDTSGRGKLYC